MNQFIGYGPNGYYVTFIDEKGNRSQVLFTNHGLWMEYLALKLGKRWVNANAQRINDILTAVANGKACA